MSCECQEIRREVITETTRLGYTFKFERTTCASCGLWKSDRLLPA